MPVTAHPLDQADERDLTELERLATEQAECPSYTRAWHHWRADPAAIDLVVARFNERIVGAVLLRDGVIVGFAVRAATRGRGVGQRLLALLLADRNPAVAAEVNRPVREFIERYRPVPR